MPRRRFVQAMRLPRRTWTTWLRAAAAERGFPKDLARQYFTRHIVYQLSAKHLEGLALFRKLVRELDAGSGLSV